MKSRNPSKAKSMQLGNSNLDALQDMLVVKPTSHLCGFVSIRSKYCAAYNGSKERWYTILFEF